MQENESNTMRVLRSPTLRWVFLLLTLGLSIVAILSAITGKFEPAGQISSIASALATILLVALTAQYAALTRELVKENQEAREQRKEERQREREREIRKLRRSLYQEIGKIGNIEDWSQEYEVGNSLLGFPAPQTVYKTNAGDIGLLTEEEIDYIVEYYSRLDMVQDLLRVQKQVDTVVGMDFLTEMTARMEGLVNRFLHKISFGYLGSIHSQKRKQIIQNQLKQLAKAQDSALSAIEDNLEEN